MPGRATDLIVIGDSFWERTDVIEVLRRRDIGHLFRLLAQYAGASQTRLAIACDMTQPKISGTCEDDARTGTALRFPWIVRVGGGDGDRAGRRPDSGCGPWTSAGVAR